MSDNLSLEIKTVQSAAFRVLTEALKEILTDANFEIDSTGIKVMAMVTERVAKGVAFLPFHFGGHMEGKDLRSKYPEGADPYVLGEAANTAFTYGYDSVTLMQESKCSLCSIERV